MKKMIFIGAAFCLSVAGCSREVVHVPTFNAENPIKLGYGEAVLPDGGIFKGQFADGLFNGTGEIKWRNGDKYEGEFKSGLHHGTVEIKWRNGDKYEGEFETGLQHGIGKMTTSNGDRYEGAFKDGKFHGKGIFVAKNGESYTGDFQQGEFTGVGKRTSGGDSFEGRFDNWRSNGEGVLILKSGDRYAGHFVDDLPSGHMVVKYKNGYRYEGGMEDWNYQGEGVLVGANGDSFSGRYENGAPTGVMDVIYKERGEVYKGELDRWTYHGKGVLSKSDGLKYEGEFKYELFDGHGTLTTPDRRRYVGEFEYGSYNGDGTLEYRGENGKRKKLMGSWKGGKYVGDDADAYVKEGLAELNGEKVLYSQTKKVAGVLSKLTPQVAGQADLYFVGFGSYGSEDVFMKEVRHSSSVMDKLYHTGGRTISLINNPATVDEVPLATVTNLEITLNGVAMQMDVNEDILFLYVTSHGSKKHEISVSLDGMLLQGLTARRLKKIIDASGIKWKVLVISACYSGGLIETLKDDYTLVMTAARVDRQSFGCGSKAEFTYFGEAFFGESLNPRVSFVEAFEHARDLISVREKKEKREPSEPQIATTPLIEKKLAEWRSKLDGVLLE